MAFFLDLPSMAMEDMRDALDWMVEHSPKGASEWYSGLVEAILSLEEMPRRCALAPESENYDTEVRQLLYTKRKVTFRVLFVIRPGDEEFEGIIRICRIRHSAQRPLTAEEIKQGEQD